MHNNLFLSYLTHAIAEEETEGGWKVYALYVCSIYKKIICIFHVRVYEYEYLYIIYIYAECIIWYMNEYYEDDEGIVFFVLLFYFELVCGLITPTANIFE